MLAVASLISSRMKEIAKLSLVILRSYTDKKPREKDVQAQSLLSKYTQEVKYIPERYVWYYSGAGRMCFC